MLYTLPQKSTVHGTACLVLSHAPIQAFLRARDQPQWKSNRKRTQRAKQKAGKIAKSKTRIAKKLNVPSGKNVCKLFSFIRNAVVYHAEGAALSQRVSHAVHVRLFEHDNEKRIRFEIGQVGALGDRSSHCQEREKKDLKKERDKERERQKIERTRDLERTRYTKEETDKKKTERERERERLKTCRTG